MHILVWAAMFAFPSFFFLLGENSKDVEFKWLLHHVSVIACYCAVFYINYLFLISRWMFTDKWKRWLGVNIAIIIVVSACLQLWQAAITPSRALGDSIRIELLPCLAFFARDIFSFAVVISIALSLKLVKRWQKTEEARKEAERKQLKAERGKAEAELKNLRNQLNPHFLLNTLNNIYALIEFDKEKAQDAVAELSKLLRYALYESQHDTVPLYKEVNFMKNYVALMEIRLSSNVKVETRVEVDPDSRTPVAPLLFISLIENAFKHGVSPTEPSFISIGLSEDDNQIKAEIVNSCYPKKEKDKSGSGIGLEQVHKRLELLYDGRYSWNYGTPAPGKVYRSELTIYKGNDSQVRDNG